MEIKDSVKRPPHKRRPTPQIPPNDPLRQCIVHDNSDISVSYLSKVHPSPANKKGRKTDVITTSHALSNKVSIFASKMLRLIAPSNSAGKVGDFFHSVEQFDYQNTVGWSPKRLDFLLFELLRLLVLTAFIFHFTVDCIVKTNLKLTELLYGGLLLVEVVYKVNTRKFVNGQIINTKIGLLRDYVRQSLALDLTLWTLIILENLGVSCGVFKLLSLLKLRDLAHIVDRFEHRFGSGKKASILFQLFKSISCNFIMAHIISLALLGMASGESESWLTVKSLQNSPWDIKYAWAFYWATTTMLTVGFGDFTATNPFEAVTVSFIEITSILMLAYTINKIGDLIKQYVRDDEVKTRKMKLLNEYFQSNHTPVDLQDRAKWCLENKCDTEKYFDTEEQDKVVRALPNDLKNQILVDTYMKKMRVLPFFIKLTSSAVLAIAKVVERKMLYDSETLIEKGVIPESMYLLAHGRIIQSIASRKAYDPVSKFEVEPGKQYLLVGAGDTIKQSAARLRLSSEGFSLVCRVSMAALISLLQQRKLDYESYCFMRDQLTIFGKDQLSQRCSHCGITHEIIECPKLHYVPIKSIVCYKHLLNRRQKGERQERRKFLREYAESQENGGFVLRRIPTNHMLSLQGEQCNVPRASRMRKRESVLKTPPRRDCSKLEKYLSFTTGEELEYDTVHEYTIYFRNQNLSRIIGHKNSEVGVLSP